MARTGYYRFTKDQRQEARHLSYEERGFWAGVLDLLIEGDGSCPADADWLLAELGGAKSVRAVRRLTAALVAHGKLYEAGGRLFSKVATAVLVKERERERRRAGRAGDNLRQDDLFDAPLPASSAEVSAKLSPNGGRAASGSVANQRLGGATARPSLSHPQRSISSSPTDPPFNRARGVSHAAMMLGRHGPPGRAQAPPALVRPEVAEHRLRMALQRERYRDLDPEDVIRAAKNPAAPDHGNAVRLCETVSRTHRLGWYAAAHVEVHPVRGGQHGR